MTALSPLQRLRLQYQPTLPKALQEIQSVHLTKEGRSKKLSPGIAPFFPNTADQPTVSFAPEKVVAIHQPKRVGVVLSGGQAAGGHNVIAGLYDALKKLHPDSVLFGFLDGPKGIIENSTIEITSKLLANYRNQGGFDLIGSGRTKIETPEQFQAAEATVRALDLDGLVVIGGDDSNTNAALLAEYFLQRACRTVVVGVPKTIDGDLRSEEIEISFGFDTATKTYSETIGSIMRDALSAKKSYYFIKLMGRSASHVTLECALQTHPNRALIGEEIAAQNKSLAQVVGEICDLIMARSAAGKEYGVILISEGVIEFIPEFKQLLKELNGLFAAGVAAESMKQKLSSETVKCYELLPEGIQKQLLLDRDPHGNVQVAKIETERLFIDLVQKELKKRKQAGSYSGKFSAQPHFCGYEGRSCLPSNFDAQYCYALGHVAALLVDEGLTGYMSCLQHLRKPVEEWKAMGIPLVTMMALEKRHGKDVPVVTKALVDLRGAFFKQFQADRDSWAIEDSYCNPGPIQFFGPVFLTDSVVMSMS